MGGIGGPEDQNTEVLLYHAGMKYMLVHEVEHILHPHGEACKDGLSLNLNLSRPNCTRRVLQHISRVVPFHLSAASNISRTVCQMGCIELNCKFRRPEKV